MANFYTDNKHLKFQLTHPLMEKIIKLKENNFAEKDKYDFAPIDTKDALDNYDKVLEILGEISGDTIDKNAESVDLEGPTLENNRVKYARGTQENLDALVKAGLAGISLPRKYNGLNFSIVPYVMSAEIVARADAGFVNIWGLQDCAETIHEFASEEQKQEFLPRINKGDTASMVLTEPDAGSDLQAAQLKASFDEEKNIWFLNGVKRFITNGDAEIALVMARSEENTSDARGISLFLFDNKKTDCFQVRRLENKLGIHGSPTCELVFKNAPAQLIGTRRMGLIKYVMSLMNSARLGIGAQSVGIAEAAYREALKYAGEREQFGKSINNFPAVFEILTDMEVRINAMRALLYETARFVDIYKIYTFTQKERKLEPEERKEMKYYQRLADIYTPLLKLISSEWCNDIASDALQIFGGTGYMKDFPIERLVRDARITNIYEGTSQLQIVAAVKGINNGGFLKKINEYADELKGSKYEHFNDVLGEMAKQLEETVNKVHEADNKELYDFHARRLVEMAGNIILSYVLLIDALRDKEYEKSAKIYIKKAKADNTAKAAYIFDFDIELLNDYRK